MMRLLFCTIILIIAAGVTITGSAANSVGEAMVSVRVTEAIADPSRLDIDRQRDKRRKPWVALSLLQVEEGMTILDIFGGDGYYTALLSRLVGCNGRVIYHNNKYFEQLLKVSIARRFGDKRSRSDSNSDSPVDSCGNSSVDSRSGQAGTGPTGTGPTGTGQAGRLGNVTRVIAEVDELILAPQSLDRALLSLTYHDFYFENQHWPGMDREAFLAHLYEALKPTGRVVVIDHQADEGRGNEDAGRLHRLEKGIVVRDFLAAGFVLAGQSDALHNEADTHHRSVFDPVIRGKTDRYILVFEK